MCLNVILAKCYFQYLHGQAYKQYVMNISYSNDSASKKCGKSVGVGCLM